MSSIYITEPATSGKVCLHTTVGPIDIELWSKECPLACRNFIQLCMEGYYNNTKFHRLIKNFIVQGGDPTNTGMGGESIYSQPFKNEFHQRLKFCRRGLLGMASENGANGSQFFFTLGATPDLDKKHTLFGKVVGDTLFNMLRLGECEVLHDDKPCIENKIIRVEILDNPFSDIVLRISTKKKKSKEKQKQKTEEKKNLSLLSFGMEAQEDEDELSIANAKFKSKGISAHDVLNDEKLSKELAVDTEQLINCERRLDSDESENELSRIRQRFLKKRPKMNADMTKENENEVDLDDVVKQETLEKRKKKLEEITAEVKSMQKAYIKALRQPKKQMENDAEDEPKSEAMKVYMAMKSKFTDISKTMHKSKDPRRQDQTLNLMKKFESKLMESSHEAQPVLSDNAFKLKSDGSTLEPINSAPDNAEAGDSQLGKLDLDDAVDLKFDELMVHKIIAAPELTFVSKAKDANIREEIEDWYSLDDPRNKMNKRRRGEK